MCRLCSLPFLCACVTTAQAWPDDFWYTDCANCLTYRFLACVTITWSMARCCRQGAIQQRGIIHQNLQEFGDACASGRCTGTCLDSGTEYAAGSPLEPAPPLHPSQKGYPGTGGAGAAGAAPSSALSGWHTRSCRSASNALFFLFFVFFVCEGLFFMKTKPKKTTRTSP